MNEDTVLVQQAVTVTEAEARSCDEGIRINIADANELIAEMAASGGWQLLGFTSFNAWASDLPKLKLSREERKQQHKDLAAAGLSLRESAAVTGAHHATVGRDLSEAAVAKATPEPEPEYYPADRIIDPNDPETKAIEAEIEEAWAPFHDALNNVGVFTLVPAIVDEIEDAVNELRKVSKPTREMLDKLDAQIQEMTEALGNLTLIRTELEWKL